MKKIQEEYYCDICGKIIDKGDRLEKPIYMPYMKPFKDDNGNVVKHVLYNNLHVEDICAECHHKIAVYVSSLMPKELIGHCGTYRGD